MPGIGGIILAGGHSRRMGRNKALLLQQQTGLTMIEVVIANLAPMTQTIIISTNTPEDYAFLSLPCIPDHFPDQGPMAGLEAGLTALQTDMVFLVACDMPFIQGALLEYLITQSAGYDAIVPLGPDEQPEPVCALYQNTCLPSLREHLQQGNVGMRRWLRDLHINLIPTDLVRVYDPQLISFSNLNTPDDLASEHGFNCV